jgi:hypothetical protein
MMARRTHLVTRRQAAEAIATVLQAKGITAASAAVVGEVLSAWITGARGCNLPHGLVAVAVCDVIEDLERHAPGALAGLR